MLVATANPCKCGYMTDPARACARVPICGEDYLGRISGPLMDRFDIPSAARASFGLYNIKEDVDVLADSLEKVREIFR